MFADFENSNANFYCFKPPEIIKQDIKTREISRLPNQANADFEILQWVGIDGDTYTNSILQTGVDFTVQNGRVTYDAWYEWYPDYAYDFTGISFKSGDTVSVSVKSSSSTAGTAVVENLTTGQKVSKAITSSAKLGGQNAEWIVEDFEQNGALVPFTNFGTVVFTGATAGTSSGGSVGIAGATLIDIKQNGKVLTSSSTSGTSQVTVKHT